MDDVTQQMKGVILSGDANNNDTNDFNAGLFQYLLFIANNASNLKVIDWSEANQELNTWMKQSNRLRLQVGGPAQDLSNFQMAPIPILSVLTCSTS
jgi:hypothetical protein